MENIAIDAAAMAALVACGDASAKELLQVSIARIEATEARVNAFTDKTLSCALREADAVDVSRAKGESLGPLAGVPYAVKNLFDVEGLVTLAGSRIKRSHQPATADAFLVKQMTAAGAVLVGALGGYFHDHASAEAREVVALAAKTLGTHVEVIWPDSAPGRAAAFIISASEGGSLHLNDLRTRADEF